MSVELDGHAWRVLPVAAVAAAGLYAGCDLDRERLRRLARARRRAEAIEQAAAALARRSLSNLEVERRLARRGVRAPDRRDAREMLSRAGYLDDRRLAAARAESLAERGHGDASIRHDLAQRGIPTAAVESALCDVDPESVRAARVVQERGRSVRTARYLAARGFGEHAIEAALGDDVAPGP